MSLCTEFFQFETYGCQITRVPSQKEVQMYDNLFLLIFFTDIMLFLVPKHLISCTIIQSEVKFAC